MTIEYGYSHFQFLFCSKWKNLTSLCVPEKIWINKDDMMSHAERREASTFMTYYLLKFLFFFQKNKDRS